MNDARTKLNERLAYTRAYLMGMALAQQSAPLGLETQITNQAAIMAALAEMMGEGAEAEKPDEQQSEQPSNIHQEPRPGQPQSVLMEMATLDALIAKRDAVTLPSRTFKPGWTPLTAERDALKAESANLKDLNCETDRALKAIAEALGIKVWYGFTPDDCLARIADLKASNARLLRLCKIVHEGDMCWDTPELEVELKEAIAKAVRP